MKNQVGKDRYQVNEQKVGYFDEQHPFKNGKQNPTGCLPGSDLISP